MTEQTIGQSHLNIGGRVLAAIDPSVYSESVAHYAAWAAKRLDAPLEYLHVLDRHPEHAPSSDLSGNLALGARETLLQELAALDESRSRLAQDCGRALLGHAQAIAVSFHGVQAESRLRHGALVDTLAEHEAQVRLFVLGKRGEHADFARGHLGSEVERVVRAMHRPILVVSRAYAEITRVLVAFDGSATTRKGVEMVAGSPLFRGLNIEVVTVGAPSDANRRNLEWALATLATAGIDGQGAIVEGEADDVIAQQVKSQQIDLLVMGAYGHSRIRQLIVGSTTTSVLRTCRVPVLLLR
ncbi:universal stress protein [Luteimonas kalidii]|uniref:Universal stress protein n=1 Tax=Luteimonas kalidii TaxID=3042025 RepID=A0ABT6JVW9_9GAMM|nr:universal stress protein [Luteimonas kalidii]MDH5834832.1 universal stress protein [Luteimonas kalidii]